jgi:hypothetical protein
MKFLNLSLKTLLIVSTVLAFSCKKPGISEISSEGQTLIKFPESDFQLVAFNLVSTPQSFDVDVRRDAANESELSKSVSVIVTLDPTVITAYNTAHSTSYIALASGDFAIDASTPRNGNNITVNFAPGEFAKPIKITVPNASTLNPNNAYALGFRIASADGAKISQLKTILVEVGLKNKYDGRFTMTGTMVDVTTSALVLKQPTEIHLVTVGGAAVEMYNAGTAVSSFLYLFPIMNGAAESAYGSFLPIFNFDANNNVISVVNSYGQPASNTRSAQIDPTGINKWNEATKTLRVKFFMFQPNTVAVGPRTTFDLTFTYLGSR